MTPEAQHKQMLALLDCAKVMRDSAGYHKAAHCHTVTESQWRAFCNQIKIVEHALKGSDIWDRPKLR
jgi:hypothetical protein